MEKSIFSRIFGAIILVSFIAISIVSALTLKNQIGTFRDSVIREKTTLLNFLEVSYEHNEEDFKSTLKSLSESPDVSFLWVVKDSGEVIYADDKSLIGKEIGDPFVGVDSLAKRAGIKDGRRVEVLAKPLSNNGKEITVILGANLAKVTAFLMPAFIRAFSIFLGAVLLSIFLAVWLTEEIISPLLSLRKAIGKITEGNLDHEINIKTNDEIEEIGEEFDEMTKRLKETRRELEEAKKVLEIRVRARTKELEELNNTLEEKVEARTEELEKKVEELEKFHKLTVGREKKMIELKEENKKLRKELGNLKEKLEE